MKTWISLIVGVVLLVGCNRQGNYDSYEIVPSDKPVYVLNKHTGDVTLVSNSKLIKLVPTEFPNGSPTVEISTNVDVGSNTMFNVEGFSLRNSQTTVKYRWESGLLWFLIRVDDPNGTEKLPPGGAVNYTLHFLDKDGFERKNAHAQMPCSDFGLDRYWAQSGTVPCSEEEFASVQYCKVDVDGALPPANPLDQFFHPLPNTAQ